MTMVVDARTPRASRRRMLTFVAAVAVLFAVLSTNATAARAAETKETARSDVGVAAWTPVISPIDSRKETVKRNLTTEQRNNLLNDCWSTYLCVAAGQGDGRHTVWELWYCTERSLSNMIDAGAINNRQVGSDAVARLLDQNKRERDHVDPGDSKAVDWRPIYYLRPC